MLLHELQHCRHKDTLISIFMNIAGIVYWFNPLIWYALKEMRCDREIACDSAVLQILHEEDFEAYGTTLINLAEKISLSPFPFTLGMGGTMKQMKRRVLNIAGFRKQTLLKKVRGIIVYAFITALLLECAPVLSIYASAPDNYHFDEKERRIFHLDLNEFFQKYDGSFVSWCRPFPV